MRKKTTKIAKQKKKPIKIKAINQAILNSSVKKLFDTEKTIFDESNFDSFSSLVYKIKNSKTINDFDDAIFVKNYLDLPDYARETIIKLLNDDGDSHKIKRLAKAIAKYGTMADDTVNVWEGGEDSKLYKDIFAETFASPDQKTDEDA